MASDPQIGDGPHPVEPFPTFEFKGSRAFFGVLLLGSGVIAAAIAALGAVVLSSLAVLYAGWAGYRVIRPGRLCVTEAGIVDETFWYSPGLIPWREVTDVRPTRWGLVEVDLVDESVFLERLGALSRMARFKQQLYGFGPALIVPWVLHGRRRTIVERLQDGLDAYTRIALADNGRAEELNDPRSRADGLDVAPQED